MALILNIETATSLCSVALSNDDLIISSRRTLEDKSHASRLTVFIEDILKETGIKIHDLNAIAVGKGPGSYTGLRIGVSTAKGLCYGAGIPLISVNTLQIMFKQALIKLKEKNPALFVKQNILLCSMIDARRMEIFCEIYNINGEIIEPTSAIIVDHNSFTKHLNENCVVFFGTGMEKCINLLTHDNSVFLYEIYPESSALSVLSYEKYKNSIFEDVAYFEPFYLKDFIATLPKNIL